MTLKMVTALMIFAAIGFVWSLFQPDSFGEECDRLISEIEAEKEGLLK